MVFFETCGPNEAMIVSGMLLSFFDPVIAAVAGRGARGRDGDSGGGCVDHQVIPPCPRARCQHSDAWAYACNAMVEFGQKGLWWAWGCKV